MSAKNEPELDLTGISFEPPTASLMVSPEPAEAEARALLQRLDALIDWAKASRKQIRGAMKEFLEHLEPLDPRALPPLTDDEGKRSFRANRNHERQDRLRASCQDVRTKLDAFDAQQNARREETMNRMLALQILDRFSASGDAVHAVQALEERFSVLQRLSIESTREAMAAWRTRPGRPTGGTRKGTSKWSVLAQWLASMGQSKVDPKTLGREWRRWVTERRG